MTDKGLVIITGGAQRIGFHLASHLLEAGNSVLITYRSDKPGVAELRQKGAKTMFADFSCDRGVNDFIDCVKGLQEPLKAIVHNASSWLKDSADQPEQVFDAMMAIHAKAPYLINMALADQLIDGGDIIHISDFVAEVGSAKHLAYAASKAALDNLTLSFARQLAPRLKVNSIAPSLIMFNDHDDGAYREKALKKSLLQIEPGADAVVEAVDFIMKSNYITGRNIALDGGRHLNLP